MTRQRDRWALKPPKDVMETKSLAMCYSLTLEQTDRLKTLAKAEKISVSALLRRIIDKHLASLPKARDDGPDTEPVEEDSE